MSKKKVSIFIIVGIFIVIASIGIAFAFFYVTDSQESTNTFSTACFNVGFFPGKSINLPAAYPMSNEKGLKTEPYTFTVKNNENCNSSFSYKVIINIKSNTDDELLNKINYSLDGTTYHSFKDETLYTLPDGASSDNNKISYLLESGAISGTVSKTYDLRLWIDESGNNDLMGKTFEAEIMLYSTPS